MIALIVISAIVAFAACVIIVVACGKKAKTKNRSVVGWVFLGIFFGPIALIIVSCAPSLDIEPRDIWACPTCFTVNKCYSSNFTNQRCKHCDTQRPPIPAKPKKTSIFSNVNQQSSSSTQRPTIPGSTWTCQKCGQENVGAAKNCINCFAEKP